MQYIYEFFLCLKVLSAKHLKTSSFLNRCKISTSANLSAPKAHLKSPSAVLNKFITGLFILSICIAAPACNRGTGCPAEEANTKTDKKGMPTSKSKSGLFDKKTTKKLNR